MELADSLLDATCLRLNFDPKEVREKIASKGVQGFVVSLVFSLTKHPVENDYLAGAITIWDLYKNCPTHVKDYAEMYKKHLRPDVYEFMIQHADELTSQLDFKKDFENVYFSVGTMIDTYLARLSYDETPREIPQMAALRIACGQYQTLPEVLNMYHRYSRREIVPSSPTFFNEGFLDGAPISCMIYTIDDSMDDILYIIMEAGMASKNSAGLGIDFQNLRHSAIGRKGISQGVIPLLKIWDDLMKYITQGGHRNGACTASLRCFHYDLPEFVRLLDKTNEDANKVSRLNLSIMVSDLFMKRVYYQKGDWYLFCPKQAKELNLLHGKEFETKYLEMEVHADRWARYKKYLYCNKLITAGGTGVQNHIYEELRQEFEGCPQPRPMSARKVQAESFMKSICEMQIKSGGPYIVYSCSVNRKNSMRNIGPVRSSNLCQETMIPAVPREQTGSCNLASMSLPAFVVRQVFDFQAFGKCVRDTVVSLNSIIDTAVNVSEKVKKSNSTSRPLGIGVSGFADMLYLLDCPPVDPKSLPKVNGKVDYSPAGLVKRKINPKMDDLNWKIWSCMYYNSLKASMEEAKKHGYCPGFPGSPFSEGILQFHMWQEEAKETGRHYPFKLTPANPSEWGQDGTWDQLISDIKTHGVRNLLLLSVQPTASSAQIIGNCESVEFPMSNIYTRKVLSGDYPVVNRHMVRDLEAINYWNKDVYNNIIDSNGSVLNIPEEGCENVERLRFIKEKYLTMWEVPQRIMVNLAAQRQICVCQSQSMNLYISSPTVDKLMLVHKYTWEMGLKTGMYYLRTQAEMEPLKIGKDRAISVAKNQMVNEIRSDLRGKKTKDMTLIEYTDPELQTLFELAEKLKLSEEHELQMNQDRIIAESLVSASVPKEAVCNMEVGCVMCA